jgi:hypothetical protein
MLSRDPRYAPNGRPIEPGILKPQYAAAFQHQHRTIEVGLESRSGPIPSVAGVE